MNIFVTDEDPVRAAINLDDKRLVKMVLETSQLLSTALHNLGYWTQGLYRPTHANHPCTLWAGESEGNFDWLVRHGHGLAVEYAYRFGKTHKSRDVIALAQDQARLVPFDTLDMTPFKNCTDIKRPGDIVEIYREYMRSKWDKDLNPRWTKCFEPDWR